MVGKQNNMNYHAPMFIVKAFTLSMRFCLLTEASLYLLNRQERTMSLSVSQRCLMSGNRYSKGWMLHCWTSVMVMISFSTTHFQRDYWMRCQVSRSSCIKVSASFGEYSTAFIGVMKFAEYLASLSKLSLSSVSISRSIGCYYAYYALSLILLIKVNLFLPRPRPLPSLLLLSVKSMTLSSFFLFSITTIATQIASLNFAFLSNSFPLFTSARLSSVNSFTSPGITIASSSTPIKDTLQHPFLRHVATKAGQYSQFWTLARITALNE